MSRQAMQQALEFCEFLWREVLLNDWAEGQREALEKALMQALAEPENQSQSQIDTKVNPAEPEQKPVAWMCPNDPDRATAFAWSYGYCIDCGKPRIPVYTAPTPRKPLTDEEIVQVLGSVRESITGSVFLAFARAIERAHGIAGEGAA